MKRIVRMAGILCLFLIPLVGVTEIERQDTQYADLSPLEVEPDIDFDLVLHNRLLFFAEDLVHQNMDRLLTYFDPNHFQEFLLFFHDKHEQTQPTNQALIEEYILYTFIYEGSQSLQTLDGITHITYFSLEYKWNMFWSLQCLFTTKEGRTIPIEILIKPDSKLFFGAVG